MWKKAKLIDKVGAALTTINDLYYEKKNYHGRVINH